MLLNQWITRWRQGFQTRPFPCDESTLPDRFAAWLLAPYLAWVAFAAVLNLSIWWLNR